MIIPVFNSSGHLEGTLRSLAAQTALPAEVLLVDDASSDATVALARVLLERWLPGRGRLVSLPSNQGPGAARNAGWEEARHPLIAFLDCDDAWTTDKLAVQYAWMRDHPEFVLSCHRMVPGRSLGSELMTLPRMLVRGPRCPTSSVMLRRDLPWRFPCWRRCEDYLLWLQMAAAGCRMARLNRLLGHKSEQRLSRDWVLMIRCRMAVFLRLAREGSLSWGQALGLCLWWLGLGLVGNARRAWRRRWAPGGSRSGSKPS